MDGSRYQLFSRSALPGDQDTCLGWSDLPDNGKDLLHEVFGLVHVLPRKRLWAYPLFAAGAGLMLGILRDASGSVIPPILAHVTVNGLNLVWLGRNHAKLTERSAAAPTPAASDAAAAGLEKGPDA